MFDYRNYLPDLFNSSLKRSRVKNQQKKYQTHQIKESNYFAQILEKIKILFQFQYFNFEQKKIGKKGRKTRPGEK